MIAKNPNTYRVASESWWDTLQKPYPLIIRFEAKHISFGRHRNIDDAKEGVILVAPTEVLELKAEPANDCNCCPMNFSMSGSRFI